MRQSPRIKGAGLEHPFGWSVVVVMETAIGIQPMYRALQALYRPFGQVHQSACEAVTWTFDLPAN